MFFLSCQADLGNSTSDEASSVRLVDGSSSCSGRVQVLHNGIWGTVCYNGWDLLDANVVCSELGCGEAKEVKLAEYFGKSSGQIWMDNVNCSGNESALSKCEYHELELNDCNHSEDAGVICHLSITIIFLFFIPWLVEGFDDCSGRVEVLHNGKWGTVCDYKWDGSDGAVVCKEMGCGNIKVLTYGAYFGATSGQIWMGNVNCNGEEASLSTCAIQGWGTHNCFFAEHAGVICGLPVRLVNGNSFCSGRVEVLHDGQWGTVSDDGWNLTDAAVVCRELGCGDVITAKGGAYFGQGSGPVWMNSVDCVGKESSLIQCNIAHWQHNNLDHLHDAGVICSGEIFFDISTGYWWKNF
uniref:SRCR domain-containing protein n=1 Tax=Sinocyclocheilus grahami TaxID=75366 RepID=A0A672P1F3_SINGR